MNETVVRMFLNGRAVEVSVPPEESLLDTLRHRLDMTGTKEGCSRGECGACTVLLDGAPVNSCLVLTARLDGANVVTIEGLAGDGRLHPIQEAFIEHGAAQCGYCTPGMIMVAVSLLAAKRVLGRDEIRAGISGNLCRCTGYAPIVDAIEKVSRVLYGGDSLDPVR